MCMHRTYLPDTERGLMLAPIAPWVITGFFTNWLLAAYWGFIAPTPQWVLDQNALDSGAAVTPSEGAEEGQAPSKVLEEVEDVEVVQGTPGEGKDAAKA